MTEATPVSADVVHRSRREADTYRRDNPRRLAGYLVLLGVYAILVAAVTVPAAATGRSLPDRWGLQDLVIVTLGTHKLSRTLTKDAVTSWFFAPRFTRLTAGRFTMLAGAEFLHLAYAAAPQSAQG